MLVRAISVSVKARMNFFILKFVYNSGKDMKTLIVFISLYIR